MITTSEMKPARSFTTFQAQLTGKLDHGQEFAPTHEQIAQSAYKIHVATGWVQGQCTQNWLKAERLLRSQGQEAARQAQQHAPEPFTPFADDGMAAPALRRRG